MQIQEQQMSDRSGVRCERFPHFHIPSVMAAKSLIYPQMSGYYDCDASYCRSRSSHLGVLLMHIIKGRLEARSPMGDIEAGPGDTFLLETYRPHVYFAAKDMPPSFYWLQFDGCGARSLAEYMIHHNRGQLFKLSKEYSSRFSNLVVELSKGHLSEVQQSARIYELIVSMERPNADSTPVQRAIAYLQNHYAETVHVEDIAAAVNLSTSHFNYCFREEYGVSPHQYLIEYRLSMGYNLVCNTSLGIDEIFEKVGYSSPSAFIAAFSKRYGATPAAMRKANVHPLRTMDFSTIKKNIE